VNTLGRNPGPVDMETLTLLLMFPTGRLDSDQRCGQACAWCSNPLADGASVALGGDTVWRPHGCPACFEARRTWMQTYLAWGRHLESCGTCQQQGAACADADTFRIQLADAGQRAGRRPPACARCQREFLPYEHYRPEPWDGNSGPVFSFVHILGSCLTPPAEVS